jgi:predicted metal-dependent hydrolase
VPTTETTPPPLPYLAGYPDDVQAQVRALLAQGRLGERLQRRYREPHGVRTDGALYDYTMALKNRHLRNAEPLSKVVFDNRLHMIGNALGTHTTVARVQGTRLKAKREIRVAGLFRALPAEFLKMIVVHELAHLKERAHDKAFYALCTHMEPDYHQLEFDLRLCLTHVEATGQALWPLAAAPGAVVVALTSLP